MKTIAVHPWPGPAPTPDDGVVVIGVRYQDSTPRVIQRETIRQAAREVLASLTGEPAGCFGIHSDPGRPLYVMVQGHDSDIGCSLSHEFGWSLAAINLHGPVGVDVMDVDDKADWDAVSRDFLGPETTAMLRAAPFELRARRFAQAWARHEALLKCAGLPLVEWSEAPPAANIAMLDMSGFGEHDTPQGAVAYRAP